MIDLHPLLRFLDPDDLKLLGGIVIEQDLPPGRTIIRINDRNRDIICLNEGTVAVRVEAGADGTRELTQINAPNLIGEINFIIPTRRTANVVALTPINVSIYPYLSLNVILRKNPRLAYKLFAALNQTLVQKYLYTLERI
jgi:CRP-like cAMP-binding protein